MDPSAIVDQETEPAVVVDGNGGVIEAPLSESEVALVMSTAAEVGPRAVEFAALFYARLFEIDPSTRPLFAGVDMVKQGSKLMSMVTAAVSLLREPDTLIPVVRQLGERHAQYGVISAEHYDSVGRALLWSLQSTLESKFTEEAHVSWSKVYALLTRVMLEASQHVSPPQVPPSGSSGSGGNVATDDV